MGLIDFGVGVCGSSLDDDEEEGQESGGEEESRSWACEKGKKWDEWRGKNENDLELEEKKEEVIEKKERDEEEEEAVNTKEEEEEEEGNKKLRLLEQWQPLQQRRRQNDENKEKREKIDWRKKWGGENIQSAQTEDKITMIKHKEHEWGGDFSSTFQHLRAANTPAEDG